MAKGKKQTKKARPKKSEANDVPFDVLFHPESIERLSAALAEQAREIRLFRAALRREQRILARRRRRALYAKILSGVRTGLSVTADKVADGARYVGRKAKAAVVRPAEPAPETG